jgi:phage terminase large subunit-like protein
LTWGNGAQAVTFSAEEPDRLRGPQHDCILADELAAWSLVKSEGFQLQKGGHAWDMAMMGLRIGKNPQALIATTPRPIPLLRELLRAGPPACVVTRATTYMNRRNLAPAFFETIAKRYEGTRLGRQELMGDILEEAEGALWTRLMLEQARDGRKSELLRTVVAVDPAVSATATSALTGIVVAARGYDQRVYVLADLSGRYSPVGWSRCRRTGCCRGARWSRSTAAIQNPHRGDHRLGRFTKPGLGLVGDRLGDFDLPFGGRAA